MTKEACVETLEEALLAERRGADRVELCSQLSEGGLTPSLDLVREACSALSIPVMAMVRPRAGDFHYGSAEFDRMLREVDGARAAGASGVVFGLLTADTRIDEERTARLAEHASPLPVTFHKAIDELSDPVAAVRTLRQIVAITRILTSGGRATAIEGLETLRAMIEVAAGNPVIIVAGKVTDENLDRIRGLTGALEFHGRRIVGSLDRADPAYRPSDAR